MWIQNWVAKHLHKHALEQVVKLLKVLFTLSDQPLHFSKQMGDANLVIEGRNRNFDLLQRVLRNRFKG